MIEVITQDGGGFGVVRTTDVEPLAPGMEPLVPHDGDCDHSSRSSDPIVAWRPQGEGKKTFIVELQSGRELLVQRLAVFPTFEEADNYRVEAREEWETS